MEEEVVDYLYKWALSDGFKKSKEDFVKLLQTNDEVLSYAFEFAQKDGFKKDKNALGVLVGRTTTAAPVATTEPAKTEVVAATIEPAKTEPTVTETAKTEPTATIATETAPTKTEVVAEEPVKELSNKPLETVKAQGIPQREAEMPVADTTKMPPMVVREVKPEVKEEPKKEMPIGENLLPITEKTEVKAVETPSDKMVIKSEKKAEEVIPNPPFETVKVFDKRKIEGKEIYSGYDKENNKWYIYNKNSKKKGWVELNKTEDKSLLNKLNSTLPIEIETIKKIDLKNQDTKIEVPNSDVFNKNSIQVDENENIVPYEYKPGSYAQMAWNQQKRGFPEAVEDSNDWYEAWYKERMKNPEFKKVATERYNAIKNRQVPIYLEALPSFQERHGDGEKATTYRKKVSDPKNKPYENKIYIGNAVYPDEGINDYYNELFTDPTKIKEYISDEAVHETSHWLENNYPQEGTNRDDYEKDKILNIILTKEYLNPNNENKLYNLEDFNGMPEQWNKYVSKPTEVRARLERWREFNKISPTKKYSKEEIENIIDDNIKEMKEDLNSTHINIMELYKLIRKNPKVLKELNEKLVSVDRKESKKTKSFNPNPFEIKTG